MLNFSVSSGCFLNSAPDQHPSKARNPSTRPTSGLVSELLSSDHILLLVLYKSESCRVERLLQLGKVDL